MKEALGEENKLGDIRVVEFIHPDSIGVTVYEVEELKEAKGKYATPGDVYWARITPGIEPFSRAELDKYLNELPVQVKWLKR